MSVALEPALLAKRILRPLLSEQTIGIIQQTIGMLDYIKSPNRGAGWGPFNGQTARQALFVDIITKNRSARDRRNRNVPRSDDRVYVANGIARLHDRSTSAQLWVRAHPILAQAKCKIALWRQSDRSAQAFRRGAASPV